MIPEFNLWIELLSIVRRPLIRDGGMTDQIVKSLNLSNEELLFLSELDLDAELALQERRKRESEQSRPGTMHFSRR